MKQQYEFVVVDDHPLFRQGLVSVIENIRSYHVIGEASTISAALQAIDDRQPQVL